MAAEQWTVGEVAELAHVTVRTLHHYDEIGLLSPSDRTEAGYRLYERAELERLHQILLYRELGFGLDAIGEMLDQPALDRRAMLRAQRDLLAEKVRNTEAVMRALDRTLETLDGGGAEMSADEMFEGFEDFDHAQYAEETKERWGETDAYRESMRRAKSYGKADWARMKREQDAIEADMAAVMAGGASPTSPEAMDVAERARQLIDRWFYPCSPRMHVGLADMYVADPRFTKHYEDRARGLAEYHAAAIRANAERQKGRSDGG